MDLNWEFVDRNGSPIYPGGVFSLNRPKDSCALPGIDAEGNDRPYDLHVELHICDPDCAGGCDAVECAVVPPQRFSCATARATAFDVPASDDPFQFELRPVLVVDGENECTNPGPRCIAAPGPRQRTVEPGLVTDLQVTQMVLSVDADASSQTNAAKLDLTQCNCVFP